MVSKEKVKKFNQAASQINNLYVKEGLPAPIAIHNAEKIDEFGKDFDASLLLSRNLECHEMFSGFPLQNDEVWKHIEAMYKYAISNSKYQKFCQLKAISQIKADDKDKVRAMTWAKKAFGLVETVAEQYKGDIDALMQEADETTLKLMGKTVMPLLEPLMRHDLEGARAVFEKIVKEIGVEQ